MHDNGDAVTVDRLVGTWHSGWCLQYDADYGLWRLRITSRRVPSENTVKRLVGHVMSLIGMPRKHLIVQQRMITSTVLDIRLQPCLDVCIDIKTDDNIPEGVLPYNEKMKDYLVEPVT